MSKLPITIITGFLGAGKTTLINKIISQHKEIRFGIVVNEFGETDIESYYYSSIDINQSTKNLEKQVIEIKNGCMCCVTKTNFISAIDTILEKNPAIEYILIEASGISNPYPIIQTFEIPNIASKYSLDSVICVVDILNIRERIEKYEVIYNQIKSANFVCLSKTEKANKEFIDKIKKQIENFENHPKLIIFDEKIDTSILIQNKTFQTTKFNIEKIDLDTNHQQFQTITFTTNKNLDYFKTTNFFNTLKNFNIIRAKGVFRFENSPKKQIYLVQYANGRNNVEYISIEKEKLKENSIIIIGEDLDKEVINKELENLIYPENKNFLMKIIYKIRNILNS